MKFSCMWYSEMHEYYEYYMHYSISFFVFTYLALFFTRVLTPIFSYLGIGWLIDIRRIPIHVRSLNRKCMLAGIIHAEDADSLQVREFPARL